MATNSVQKTAKYHGVLVPRYPKRVLPNQVIRPHFTGSLSRFARRDDGKHARRNDGF